jgi:hypothetical protein
MQTTVQNIPDSPDISLNDVFYFHDCAHGDSLRRKKECHGFDVSWIPHDGAMDVSNVYITDLDEATTYTFFGWKRIPQESAKLGGRQCNHYRISPMLRYFAQRRVFTSMTVHMETPPT